MLAFALLCLIAPVAAGGGYEIIPEAAGGAHRDAAMTASKLRASIKRHLKELCELSTTELVERRYQKFRKMGAFVESPG